jgi:hypothetical protein
VHRYAVDFVRRAVPRRGVSAAVIGVTATTASSRSARGRRPLEHAAVRVERRTFPYPLMNLRKLHKS